jgi:hypothetical protein
VAAFLTFYEILNFAICPAEAGKVSYFFKELNCYKSPPDPLPKQPPHADERSALAFEPENLLE